jgi:hypothetical protein
MTNDDGNLLIFDKELEGLHPNTSLATYDEALQDIPVIKPFSTLTKKEIFLERLRLAREKKAGLPKTIRQKVSRKKAIKDFCLWCCCSSQLEVRECLNDDCALHKVRKSSLSSKGLSLKRIIRDKCFNCSNTKTRNCEETSCALHGKW